MEKRTAYIVSIHQTEKNLAPVVFKAVAITPERRNRLLKHAMEIDAIFMCHAEEISESEWYSLSDIEKKKFKAKSNWGFDLPPAV